MHRITNVLVKRRAAVVAALFALSALAASPVQALNIGYYEMCNGAGSPAQEPPITNAGHTAVNLLDLSPVELAGVDVIMVNNCDNGFYGAEYLANLANIDAAVASGKILILHDRFVDLGETILPGGSTFDVQRHPVFPDPLNEARDINVLDGSTLITNGPAGVITDTSLDNGNFSNHGFTVAGSLPGTATLVLSTNVPTHIVTFVYAYGSGFVLYSSIPLDHYLGGTTPFSTIYAVNLAHYAAFLVDQTCGNGNIGAGEQCDDGNVASGDGCSATCSIEIVDGDIFITQYNVSTGGSAAVLRIDPVTGAQGIVSKNGYLWRPRGIATDAAGNLYVADQNAGGDANPSAIIRIDIETGVQTLVSSGGLFNSLFGISLENDGSIIAARNPVLRVDPGTGAQSVVSQDGFLTGPQSVAIAANGDLYTIDEDNDRIIRVDPVSGAQTLVSQGGMTVLAGGIDIEADGGLIAGDRGAGGSVYRIDPTSGTQTALSSGGSLVYPLDVAVDDSGDIVVADKDAAGSGAVIRVDGVSGAQTTLATGGLVLHPFSVAVLDLAECGDGVREAAEQCDDGNATNGDCCSDTCAFETAGGSCADEGDLCTTDECDGAGACIHPDKVDSDVDGTCDEQDVCNNVAGGQNFLTAKPRPNLTFTKVNNDVVVGNDGFKLGGEFALAAGHVFADVNPLATGVRVLVDNAADVERVDQLLPGGAYGGRGTRGWKLSGTGTTWSYTDTTASPLSGIKRMKITNRSKAGPRRVKVSLSGVRSTYPVVASDTPLNAVVVLGDQLSAIDGLCGETTFGASSCKLNGAGTTVTCK